VAADAANRRGLPVRGRMPPARSSQACRRQVGCRVSHLQLADPLTVEGVSGPRRIILSLVVGI
jgi:hypothetical protein